MSANPSLPILAEVCGGACQSPFIIARIAVSSSSLSFFFLVGEMLTVADKGLVVLDRLFENKKSET